MADYVEFIAQRLPARPFKGPLGERFSGFVGGFLANLIALGSATAVQALWLIAGQPGDVLSYQGGDRRLRRYIAETDDDDYRERLGRALEIWEEGGTASCLLDQLDSAGYENAEIHTPRDWGRSPLNHISQFWAFLPFASHADGSPFFLCGGVHVGSGTALLCGEAGLVCGDGTPFGPGPLAGSGQAIAGQHTAGITAPPGAINELRYIAKTFKAGDEVCRQIIVEIDGPICGTGLLCGTGGASTPKCGGTVGVIGTGVAET